jgi:hypothetical protein
MMLRQYWRGASKSAIPMSLRDKMPFGHLYRGLKSTATFRDRYAVNAHIQAVLTGPSVLLAKSFG